ncbi:loganic acid O-methyltransferase-like [Rhodamnia argentea]|uniref:Loganic acid O-methyltransferase-like n=1 Tax=Rhodamnia argentea TaxID=178133 RepID=A0ABM3GYV0_9MYRT|nr:loganic acid O-methyltransferase-like [Rhodamnia argentea]
MASVESFPMNGGGIYSYSHSSFLQRRGIDVALKMIDEMITEKLDVGALISTSSIFRIADLGCSVGPNTYFVVERGLPCEEKIHSFNLPLYHPTLAEMEALVKRNGQFNMERMGPLVRLPHPEASEVMADVTMMHFRAGWEGLIKAHFGGEMVDPVFEHFRKKVKESSVFADPSYNRKAETFILL